MGNQTHEIYKKDVIILKLDLLKQYKICISFVFIKKKILIKIINWLFVLINTKKWCICAEFKALNSQIFGIFYNKLFNIFQFNST